jgi:hypothetical protein
MEEPRRVHVFFYGSFINREVLAEGGYQPDRVTVARLDGFDVVRRPLVTLAGSDRQAVYGILTRATHVELDRLYGQRWVRAYRPEPVVVTTRDGAWYPALCYIAPGQTEAPPFDGYLDRILGAARELSFPEWYIERLEALR